MKRKKKRSQGFNPVINYGVRWLPGDENAGRRWVVINISHAIYLEQVATEKEAKAIARTRQKERKRAAQQARAMEKPKRTTKEPNKNQLDWMAKKLAAKSFKNIPFPT